MERTARILIAAAVTFLGLGVGTPAIAGKLRVIGVLTIDGVGSAPVLSFSSGVSQGVPGTVSSSGTVSGQRVDFTGLRVMKPLDATSPRLFLAAAKGEHFRSARLELYGPGSTVTASIVLGDVLVASIAQGGSAAAEATGEEVTLVFGRIQVSYNGPNGTTTGGWDLQQNRPL